MRKRETYSATVLGFSDHETNRGPGYTLSGIHVVQMILNALDGPDQIRLVKFVDGVPAKWAVFAPFQQDSVQESHGVNERRPSGRWRVIQKILRDVCQRSFHRSADPLRRFVGELDGRLKETDGELAVDFGGDPQPEIVVNGISLHQSFQHFVTEREV